MQIAPVPVLIPAHNAARSLTRLLERVVPLDYVDYVLVVDDGSSDNTAEAARSAGARTIRIAVNRGKGAALRTGFDYILRRGNDRFITMDADGQHDPAYLVRFIRRMEETGADMVIGNRMTDASGMPYDRVFSNYLTSKVISILALRRIPDSQCGYRIIKRRVVERIALRSERFEIEGEMVLKAARAGFKIAHLPISAHYGGESSHIRRLADTVRFTRMVFSNLFYFPGNLSRG